MGKLRKSRNLYATKNADLCNITFVQKHRINSYFQFIYIYFSFHRWACGSMDSSCVGAPGAHNPHCETSGK